AFATLTQYEAELISIGPRYLGRSQASVIQFKSVTEQGEGFFSHLARNAHEILLFHAAIFPDEGTRDGTVLCEYKQTCRVNIQTSRRRKMETVLWGISNTTAIAGVPRSGSDQRCRVAVAILRLARD